MQPTLADLTTMRVGGPAAAFSRAETRVELLGLLQGADATSTPVLVLGGGSNLIVGDAGFDGLVLQVATSGMRLLSGDRLSVAAGVDWDDVVLFALDAGLSGLESLSGIPGSAGGTPVQNVGAYGTLTSDVLASLTVYDRQRNEVQTWTPEACGFGTHRDSVFKRSNRHIVLEVSFQLSTSKMSGPIRYAALADRLGVDVGDAAPPLEVRAAVLELRRERGMLLDATDHDTWSVGSFFLNPVVPTVPEQARSCPQYPDPAGTKLSAAWLIEQSGFARGYGRGWGRGNVTLSSKHTLAVTNRGGARTSEVMAFATHIRDGVAARFGVPLEPECDLVNCGLE